MSEDKVRVGVAVGRFQTDELHVGHRGLLNYISEHSDFVFVGVGVGELPTSSKNPLPAEYRLNMVYNYLDGVSQHGSDSGLRGVHVFPVADHPSDYRWSEDLDTIIEQELKMFNLNNTEVTLYGSRDSFFPYYHGKYPCENVDEVDMNVSATERRRQISHNVLKTPDFAKGVIWANENKFPTVYGVVDAIIISEDRRIAMITKNKHGDKLMLPGGFCDPASVSDEHDVSREVWEEICISIAPQNFKYCFSTNINDWRYRGERDVLRTKVFLTTTDGPASKFPLHAGDDADGAEWVDIAELMNSNWSTVYAPHADLIKKALTKVELS